MKCITPLEGNILSLKKAYGIIHPIHIQDTIQKHFIFQVYKNETFLPISTYGSFDLNNNVITPKFNQPLGKIQSFSYSNFVNPNENSCVQLFPKTETNDNNTIKEIMLDDSFIKYFEVNIHYDEENEHPSPILLSLGLYYGNLDGNHIGRQKQSIGFCYSERKIYMCNKSIDIDIPFEHIKTIGIFEFVDKLTINYGAQPFEFDILLYSTILNNPIKGNHILVDVLRKNHHKNKRKISFQMIVLQFSSELYMMELAKSIIIKNIELIKNKQKYIQNGKFYLKFEIDEQIDDLFFKKITPNDITFHQSLHSNKLLFSIKTNTPTICVKNHYDLIHNFHLFASFYEKSNDLNLMFQDLFSKQISADVFLSTTQCSTFFKINLFNDIISALNFLHRYGFVHGDLRLENIVIVGINTQQTIAKLSNICNGFAIGENKLYHIIKQMTFFPPEFEEIFNILSTSTLQHNEFSKQQLLIKISKKYLTPSIDIYFFGLVMIQFELERTIMDILIDMNYYNNNIDHSTFQHLLKIQVWNELFTKFSCKTSNFLKSIIINCLKNNPKQRSTSNEVYYFLKQLLNENRIDDFNNTLKTNKKNVIIDDYFLSTSTNNNSSKQNDESKMLLDFNALVE
ncbi:hypothetical protein QTN25_007786 [Entamoeba marina]